MDVLRALDALPAGTRFVATVGVFDGMHRGHVQVLQALTRLATETAAIPVVLTFHPHPQVLISGSAPPLLCDPAERLARLAQAGIGITILQTFDEAFRMQTAEAFLQRLRVGRDLRGLVMSSESAFGHDREGTVATTRRSAAHEGWTLLEVPTLEVGRSRVSSGRIRGLIGAGKLDEARRLLGRRYAVSGQLGAIDETGLGRRMGFDEPVALPREGIYEVAVGALDEQRAGLLRVARGSLAVRREDGPDWPAGGGTSQPLRVELVRRVARQRWTAGPPGQP